MNVFDLQNEVAEHRQDDQHEDAGFCCRGHLEHSVRLSIVKRVNTGFAEHLKKQSKRQSNHIGVTAMNGVDKHAPGLLRRVGSGFVERLAGPYVPIDVS